MRYNLAIKYLNTLKILKKFEIKIKVYRSLSKNLNIPLFLRIFYFKKLVLITKNLKLMKIKTKRCILTNKARGFIRLIGLSRIKLKKFINLRLINGFNKASW